MVIRTTVLKIASFPHRTCMFSKNFHVSYRTQNMSIAPSIPWRCGEGAEVVHCTVQVSGKLILTATFWLLGGLTLLASALPYLGLTWASPGPHLGLSWASALPYLGLTLSSPRSHLVLTWTSPRSHLGLT